MELSNKNEGVRKKNDASEGGTDHRNAMGRGIAIGITIGCGTGAALGNLAIGAGIGVAIGVALGVSFRNQHAKSGEK